MTTKLCSRCKCHLPLEAFNRHRKAKTGRQAQCRTCNNAFRISWHREDPERTRAYDRARAADPKVLARRAVAKAIKTGELHKPEHCSVCGASEDIHGHHDDYGQPLCVVWVCRGCHEDLHAAARE